jgi:Flp pilus assembly CpaE family ATPase
VELFGTGGGERTAAEAGIPFLGRVPFDPRLVRCADAGDCILQSDTDSPVAEAFRAIAEKIARIA